MNTSKWYITVYFILAIIIGCQTKSDERIIARAFDKELTSDEFKLMMPSNLHGKDSVEVSQNIIDAWIEKSVILHQAEVNLSDEDRDVEQQLEDYRTSIITYKYENALANEKLDTTVSNDEIEKYYNAHTNDFELKDNIIKVWYLKVKVGNSLLPKLKTLIKKSDSKSKAQLEELCQGNTENYYLKEDTWLLFDDMLKEIPIKTYDIEHFLQNNRLLEINDKSFVYLVNIIDFKIKDSISPLAFEYQSIRNIILNKRRLEIIQNMRNDVMNEAKNNKEIEVFR